MASIQRTFFTTIRTEGALLPPDLLQRIADGNSGIDGLTPADYHRPGEKLNEAINRSWNALQGAWANFKAARDKLPTGDLGTSITRERWLLPLFRELDYGRLQTASAYLIDGKSYSISHSWEQVPIHLVSYRLDLDHRTPGIAGASAASPHSTVQVFLNRSEDAMWGFVSNGRQLRVLRDNVSLTRQSYVEFDLESMMEGEVYADFVLLWLVCHQSRVENGRDCWLEKWMKIAEQQGTRALDHLRDTVEQAIEALGVGFLEHPHNTTLRDKLQNGALNAQDYYRQLLRLVYRMLFLFVAEDRGLLYDPAAPQEARDLYTAHYSTQRLRRVAERLKGTRHTDLFESLRLVMKLLSGDANGASAQLGLPVLGSFLFSDDAVVDVIGCQIDNIHLLDAVRVLAFIEDRAIRMLRPVDYKNLDSDELGSVYESLLELHPQINVPARTFALATAGGNERKTTGSYYTPTSLINALLDSALDPIIAEAMKKPVPEAGLLDLKICDPACGSGHFLIAAAHRVAKALASVRTGEEEPSPAAIRHALRDVIGNCIYGVDINPMAVELCKVALWLDALEPGKPLSFLDHRIQCGNSLLGTTPALMAQGIPDDAFNPIEGDDPKIATALKKRNRQERKDEQTGQASFFDLVEPSANYAAIAEDVRALNAIDDETLAGIRAKEERYRRLADDPDYQKARGLADAWCAAFVWDKTANNGLPPMTNLFYRRLQDDLLDPALAETRAYVESLRERYQFFHWHVAFPDVFDATENPASAENPQTGWNGGFDCVLGNPPWERIKIQEKEWFAQRNPDIANAPNAAARRRMIEALVDSDPRQLQVFKDDLRQAEGESYFVRISGRFPLCGRGDVNTYTLFAELNRGIISIVGRVGCIVPSGIATDDTTKFFFQDLMQTQTLVSLYDFENRENIFEGVGHGRFKFCLLTLTGSARPVEQGAEFIFFALRTEHLKDVDRRFTLTADEIRLINPNTKTCATFRSKRDAELTKAIYRRVPVLIQETQPEDINPWGISFLRMFDMSNDSHLFHTRDQLEQEGYQLQGNVFVHPSDMRAYLPLYEAKMVHQFNHRFGDYNDYPEDALSSHLPDIPVSRLQNPNYSVLPRYWVEQDAVEKAVGSNSWLLGFRDITNSTNERTAIAAILPRAGVSNKFPILILNRNIGQFLSSNELSLQRYAALYSNLSSFIFDYAVRQKMGGTSLNFFIVRQLPIVPGEVYSRTLLDFIASRALELIYTAWDIQLFARDMGYDGPPFIWDEERRFIIRCELDALYFHLYGIARDDVDHIMETFPIVKRKDEAAHGEYRTKRVIRELYDEMAGGLEGYTTPLNPLPADPRVAHV